MKFFRVVAQHRNIRNSTVHFCFWWWVGSLDTYSKFRIIEPAIEHLHHLPTSFSLAVVFRPRNFRTWSLIIWACHFLRFPRGMWRSANICFGSLRGHGRRKKINHYDFARMCYVLPIYQLRLLTSTSQTFCLCWPKPKAWQNKCRWSRLCQWLLAGIPSPLIISNQLLSQR